MILWSWSNSLALSFCRMACGCLGIYFLTTPVSLSFWPLSWGLLGLVFFRPLSFLNTSSCSLLYSSEYGCIFVLVSSFAFLCSTICYMNIALRIASDPFFPSTTAASTSIGAVYVKVTQVHRIFVPLRWQTTSSTLQSPDSVSLRISGWGSLICCLHHALWWLCWDIDVCTAITNELYVV